MSDYRVNRSRRQPRRREAKYARLVRQCRVHRSPHLRTPTPPRQLDAICAACGMLEHPSFVKNGLCPSCLEWAALLQPEPQLLAA